MCVDANAAARNAARQRWMEKDANFRSASLKFWNRETSAQRGLESAALGYSRALSNDFQRALYIQGQARKQYETAVTKFLAEGGDMKAREGGRSRTAGKKRNISLNKS